MAYIILLLILSAFTTCEASKPKDHYLLSCGSTSTNAASPAFDGRTWYPDQNHTFSSSFTSTIAVSANHNPSAPDSPFTAARIFNTSFTYTFPVSPGPKFLRLFFYPALYSDQFDASGFFITVQANGRFLLRNFSAQLAVSYATSIPGSGNTSESYVIKEYYLTVPNSKNSLQLTFTPTPPTSYAFVNGIEIVSVQDGLYLRDNGVSDVQSPLIPFQIPISSALETVYRLNVGGSEVSVKTDGDQCGMYRHWKNDDSYTFGVLAGLKVLTPNEIAYTMQVPNYTAPKEVYQTYRQMGGRADFNEKHNLTWRFKVDPGFNYLLRLHWCELSPQVNEPNDLVFEVYINNLTAESGVDVMMWTKKRDVPVFRDYVISVGGDGGSGPVDMWLALHPNTDVEPKYKEVLLNGLEIFKINRADGGLDAPNPNISLDAKNLGKQNPLERRKRSHLAPIIGGIMSGILVASLLVFCLIFRHKKATKDSSTSGTRTSSRTNWIIIPAKSVSKTSSRGSTLPSDLCRQFSLVQIELATNNFDERLIIGHGGFGNVYKGMVAGEEGLMKVAIKRLNQSSKQGVHEFKTEIELLSKLRHVHLVSLIGYCDDDQEMILVYEYMDRGTLRDHLYNTDNPPLSWNQRLNACLGAAKGLHYLHAGASQMIIHRDVKSTNILVDEKWVAKVSDFGLSKLGPMSNELSHISTVVKGSFGYVDPEYLKRQQLTEKSDVYSFGVVLFEVLCGRPALNPNLPKEQANLALWARSCQKKGDLGVIVDLNIKDEIAPVCLRKFGEIAERCVRDHGSDRPSMADVVWSLEFALDLQQKAVERGKPGYPGPGRDVELLPSTKIAVDNIAKATTSANHDSFDFTSTTSGERLTRTNSSSSLIMSASEDRGEAASASVFSEIFKPQGR